MDELNKRGYRLVEYIDGQVGYFYGTYDEAQDHCDFGIEMAGISNIVTEEEAHKHPATMDLG